MDKYKNNVKKNRPAHPRLNLKKYLLNKNILFKLYFMKKEAHERPSQKGNSYFKPLLD